MVVPLVMLLILAFVVIRSLMIVVGREDEMPATHTASEPLAAGMPGMPAPQLRARADDGVRGLMLPAVADMEFVDDPAHSDAS